MNIEPIGYFRSEAAYKQEVPRQGVFFSGHPGRIELLPGKNFETALRDLDGFERLWVIFQFDRNEGWRPTTRPPVGTTDRERVGTFASRSPYRPNPIGLSCVRLLKIEKLTLSVDEADLLDGTPVFDIKPYIPKADSFSNARAGWADEQAADPWDVHFADTALQQNEFLVSAGGPDLVSFARVQLGNAPMDASRKRVEIHGEKGVLSFRVFRIAFVLDAALKQVRVERFYSGYTAEELASVEDRYNDKELHRKFTCAFLREAQG